MARLSPDIEAPFSVHSIVRDETKELLDRLFGMEERERGIQQKIAALDVGKERNTAALGTATDEIKSLKDSIHTLSEKLSATRECLKTHTSTYAPRIDALVAKHDNLQRDLNRTIFGAVASFIVGAILLVLKYNSV